MAGFECPGCGMTHAFVHLTHGQWRESIRWHRVGALLYAFFVMQIVVRSYVLRRPEALDSARLAALQYYASTAMIVLLIGNFLVAIVTGSNGS